MLLLRNYVVDFVEICNVCARKAIIEAAKRIINSDKVCRNYSDLNFGVTFLEHSVCWYKISVVEAEYCCNITGARKLVWALLSLCCVGGLTYNIYTQSKFCILLLLATTTSY